MSGLGDKLKGSAKEAAGKLTGNDKLEAEGKMDQISGNVKDKFEGVKDTMGEKANELLDKAKNKTDDEQKN